MTQVLALQGGVMGIIWKRVGSVILLSLAVTWAHEELHIFEENLSPLPFTFVGVALGIFLGFRNNTGYDRFWEGRKLWGRQVNQTRSFARQLLSYLQVPTGKSQAALRTIQVEMVYRTIAFTHALRHHLRMQRDMPELSGLLPADEIDKLSVERNIPLAIATRMTVRLGELLREGWIDPFHLAIFEAAMTEFGTIQGACERIKNTPIPASYSILLHRIVLVYCIGLPFGIVDVVGWYTPIVSTLVAYAFYGLDAAGVEVEEPFGFEPNDLPLSALSTTIEINLRQQLGETQLPEDPRPNCMILS